MIGAQYGAVLGQAIIPIPGAGATIEYAQENVPEQAANIKASINNFAVQNNIPFSFA